MELKSQEDIEADIKKILDSVKIFESKDSVGFVLVFTIKPIDGDSKVVARTIQIAKRNVGLEQIISALEMTKLKELKMAGVLND